MKDFHCRSVNCKDDCCYGWKVTVDKATYKNFRNVQRTSVKNELIKYILRNEDSKIFNY
ncbi:hypothetical protein [Clostridium sp. VAP51]|uniref:hypothetical protein n=1 Tax=Clostridium sp. VAP51 TaxID=2949978 RepID=UPI002079A140|nr:hypothetical protein [Clostridium sp. VAP51]